MENLYLVIGILCIDTAEKLYSLYGPAIKSYIAASYVKFVESAGAQVVPIWIGMSKQYYEDIMQRINGILLPGGAVFFDSKYIDKPENTNECVESAKLIYQITCEMNDRGTYFPLFGICLGYELLLYHSVGGKELRQDCSKLNKSMSLDFESDFKDSKMFKNLPEHMEGILKEEPFAFHFHRYCITKNDLKEFNIDDKWKVTSVNRDDNDLEFISTIEHKTYPIYGLQFHPEKVIFEWTRSDNISHSSSSVQCAQFFGNFFISECRKNSNCFAVEDKDRHLIYNFNCTYTGINDTKWVQCYLFNEKSEYRDWKTFDPMTMQAQLKGISQ